MGAMDHQLGFGNETTYGTAVTGTRFYEYESESISDNPRRTEGDPLRVGSAFIRSDRFTPWYGGATGNVQMSVLTKGFGYFLQHMVGSTVTTGPTDSVYTHTGSEGALHGASGDSFTCQVNRPFHPSGTNQAFTYTGGKVTDWTLSNDVDGNLILDLGLFFAQVTTATGLWTASYPTNMDNLTWAGGLVTIGGSAYDVTSVAIKGDNGFKTDRQQIRQLTDTKEPTSSRRSGEFSIKADFESLTQRNRALATTRAGALSTFVATWRGPTLAGASTYPELTVTVASARWDDWKGPTEGPDAVEQELSGVVRYESPNTPIQVVYKSVDSTA